MTEILLPMTVLSPHDEEQTIVFETEMLAPVCLFPLVPPTASVSLDGITSGDEDALATDAVWMLPDATPADEGALGSREDALLGPNTATSDPSFHLPPYKKHSDDAPIPLDSHFAFHNTVEMLLPATGPPHHLVGHTTRPFSIPATHHCSSHASCVDCCAHECWPTFDPHSCDLHLDDPLGVESCDNYLDHGESQLTLANLLPFNYGENQLTVDYGECLPALKVHSKDLDNDGEITTKLISTITTDDPVTDALLLYGKDSQQIRACIIQQANEIHDKDLDNDGEITTKLISTITTDDPITNTW